MRINMLPFGRLVLALLCMCLCIDTIQAVQQVYSGSGDLPKVGRKDMLGLFVQDGSGSGMEVSIPSIPHVFDDEDYSASGFVFASGDGIEGSGSTTELSSTSEFLKCSETYLYCWCVDYIGIEIPKTRIYVAEALFHHDCDDLQNSDSTKTVIDGSTDATSTKAGLVIVDLPPTTSKSVTKKQPSPPPYVVDSDKDHDGNIKVLDHPKDGDKPSEGVDFDGILGDEEYDVVEKEQLVPLFSHPGILAAMIGGGVVALLCALLLVMFIVYRMRKKGEMVDPNAKPPRLNYTQAPSKESYLP